MAPEVRCAGRDERNSLLKVLPLGNHQPMGPQVLAADDPGHALVGGRLPGECDPVRPNVILTLLHRRVAHPEAGCYWTDLLDGEPAGFVFQSPLDFVAVDADGRLGHRWRVGLDRRRWRRASPGSTGRLWPRPASPATRPSATGRSLACPGQRFYEVRQVVTPRPGGNLRRAALIHRARRLVAKAP